MCTFFVSISLELLSYSVKNAKLYVLYSVVNVLLFKYIRYTFNIKNLFNLISRSIPKAIKFGKISQKLLANLLSKVFIKSKGGRKIVDHPILV